MATYKQLVYMSLDLLKISGDDSYYTEDHVIFLLDKFRVVLLEQKYSNKAVPVADSNYQTLCLGLEEKEYIDGLPCAGVSLRSVEKVPDTVSISKLKVYPSTPFSETELTYVSKERFKFVGHNKWLKNIVYVTEDNGYIYLKSENPQYKYLENVTVEGVFENTEEAAKLNCKDSEHPCDILDAEYPLENGLLVPLIELVVKELSGGLYKPQDDENNAKDDLSSLATFIARNTKSNLQKQIEQ